MADDFGCTVQELEAELTELIAADRVQARIDADKQILYARQVSHAPLCSMLSVLFCLHPPGCHDPLSSIVSSFLA